MRNAARPGSVTTCVRRRGKLSWDRSQGGRMLQGHSAIYSGGYSTNLRDITSGTNGTCGTDCTAGAGYDLVTGLGSPVNYP